MLNAIQHIVLFIYIHMFVLVGATSKWMELSLCEKEAADRKDKALAMAKIIIDKDVKVPSPTITAIKNEMRRLIEALETTSDGPAFDSRTSDQPDIEETRQGASEGKIQPNGSALPP